jgi:hypothetical protein
MKDLKLVFLDAVLNEVKAHVDVFSPGMMLRIFRKCFGAGVVNMEWNESGGNKIQLPEQMAKPQTLLAGVGHGFVLRFCAGE